MTNDPDDVARDRAGETGLSSLPGQAASIANTVQTRLLGIGLLVLALLLAYLFLMLWPSGLSTETKGDEGAMICLAARVCFIATVDVRLLMIVMVAGALGSFIHTATSFGDFVGNNKLSSNWIWWYILRPFIGTALAAIFYLVIRGGFLSSGSQAGHINLYGIVALAGMVGMFSKQATDKLGEVFDTLFKTTAGGGDSKRKDSLENPVPVLQNRPFHPRAGKPECHHHAERRRLRQRFGNAHQGEQPEHRVQGQYAAGPTAVAASWGQSPG